MALTEGIPTIREPTQILKRHVQQHILKCAVGCVVMVTGLASTIYLVRDGFTWWSLATGWLCLTGCGLVGDALERVHARAGELWGSVCFFLGLVSCSLYLFRRDSDGWGVTVGIAAFLALVSMLDDFKKWTQPTQS